MPFALNQSNDGQLQLAGVMIPGLGRNEKDNAPTVMVEIEDGQITLMVYADINSGKPTHEIPMNGAKLANRSVHASVMADLLALPVMEA